MLIQSKLNESILMKDGSLVFPGENEIAGTLKDDPLVRRLLNTGVFVEITKQPTKKKPRLRAQDDDSKDK